MGKSTPKYRLVCGKGQLKNVYTRSCINPFPNATPNLMGLQEAYGSQQGLPNITEHEATRLISTVVGQGIIRCDCTSKCATKR